MWEVTPTDSATEPVTFPGSSVAAGYRTTYSYDALDDLLNAKQRIGTTGTLQTRTFVYDGLKRLKQAINPESGTVNYTYDANSNLATKQDARLIMTTYAYDALNRVKSRTYTNDPQSTPAVSYKYDNQALTGGPSFTVGSSIGRLIAVTYGTGSAGSYQGYDQLGRVNVSYQQTDSINYGFGYGYNLASEMTTENYPSGRQITTEYDTAGRAGGISARGFYYAGSSPSDATNRIQYAAHGAVSVMALGNGKWEHTNFNNRLQPTQIGLGTSGTDSSILKLDYGYGTTTNNGNVMSQTITAPMAGGGNLVLNQTYTYDALNRLLSASETGSPTWAQNYDYDRYGNRAVNPSSTLIPNPALTPTSLNNFSTATNRITLSGFGYDGAGNMTNDPTTLPHPPNGMLYDGENRQISYTKVYLTSDHLGSTRVVMKSDGTTVKARYDYLPFGEEIPSTIGGRGSVTGYGGSDSTKQKFTQKERDSESGLDYFLARYYSSAQGRFTSTEPLNILSLQKLDPKRFLLVLATPQNWNAYAYCHNNPLSKLDPDGFLTIVIPGTWNARKKWKQSEFVKEVSKTFGEDAIVLKNNNMGNSKGARTNAAKLLEEIVRNHEFAPGEKLNIVAHSHGGNVVFQATKEGLEHKVDTLVTLGTPIRPDYQPNEEMIGEHIQVYSNNDEVQPHGGPGSLVPVGPLMGVTGEMGPAKRTLDLPGVKNLDASAYANGHSELWQKTSTWTNVVAPEIKK